VSDMADCGLPDHSFPACFQTDKRTVSRAVPVTEHSDRRGNAR
jgi:hypothetical protein